MTSASGEAELRLKYIHESASTVTNSQAEPSPGEEQAPLNRLEVQQRSETAWGGNGGKRKGTVQSIIVRGVYLFQVWQFGYNVFLF